MHGQPMRRLALYTTTSSIEALNVRPRTDIRRGLGSIANTTDAAPRPNPLVTNLANEADAQKRSTSHREKRQSVDRQLSDIVLNDLSATLESHRESNRASIIRKYPVRASELAAFKFSPEPTKEDVVEAAPSEIKFRHVAAHSQASKTGKPQNPVLTLHLASTQQGSGVERSRIPGKRGGPESAGTLKYQGQYVRPISADPAGRSLLPWLEGLDVKKLDGIDRYYTRFVLQLETKLVPGLMQRYEPSANS